MSESADSRRPLKTRQWGVFRKLADWLARKNVTPNIISVSSVVFAIGAGFALWGTSLAEDDIRRRSLWFLAAVLIQLRLLANLLDGMVAIEGGKKSVVGELYNEVPDRISDPAILIGAGYAAGGSAELGLLAAGVALFVAYVRSMGVGVGVGQVFLGPMAKPQRMALLTAICVYNCVTHRDWQPLWQDEFGIVSGGLTLIIVGGVITALRRLLRIGRLLRRNGETGDG